MRGAEVQARASRGSSGKVQLLRTPRPPPPCSTPGRRALPQSKDGMESLRGREGRPHHLPLNVNYAFMNVFIGSDAPRPPPPLCGPRSVGLFVAWGWAGRACRMSTLSEEWTGEVLKAPGTA